MTTNFKDRAYVAICSEKTLQSNEKGFFMSFVDQVINVVGHEWINKVFRKCSDDLQRLKTVYENETIRGIVCSVLANVQELYREKDLKVSRARYVEAEREYNKGDYKKALMFYSQSILRSPPTNLLNTDSGYSLALALFGRAKALIKLEEYSFALYDLQLAIKENLPSDLKGDTFWNMGICHKAKGDLEKAKISFGVAEKLLKDTKKLERLKKDSESNYFEKSSKKFKEVPSVSGEQHTEFPNASEKITVKEAPGMGRYVIADQKISTGEVIVVEEPYAACLVPDCFGTHCHNCFERLISPVGCTTCSNIAFCSLGCRDIALSTYHRYECKFLNLLLGSGMSILSLITLRMVTQTTVQKQLEIFDDREKEKVYTLCTNASMREPADFLQRTLMIAFLLRSLQVAGYFGRDPSNIIPTEDEYKVGSLMLYSLQMLQFNGHEIYETRHTPEHRFRSAKAAYIGVGVFPTVALFNHDCYPGVTRYFIGKKIVINAVRPINPGDLVAENYGPVFTRKSLAERQRSLSSRYWFDCRCTACVQDWPSLDNGLDNVSRRIRCPTARCSYFFTLPVPKEVMKCPRCKKIVSLTDHLLQMKTCEEQYQKAIDAMEAQDPKRAISLLCQAIDTFHRVSCPPHRDTSLGQEILRACLADSGNVYNCLVKNS